MSSLNDFLSISSKTMPETLNVNNVDTKILDPKNSWEDPNAYDAQAKKLVSMFIDNFTQFENDVDENVKSSGPVSI